MHNIPREKYFDMFLKVKKILAVFLKFLSNWFTLIMLCENFTVFWGSSLDCNSNYSDSEVSNISKLHDFINKNVSDSIYFHIPFIITDQVQPYIQLLDSSKATGLDGLGAKIKKRLPANLSPILAALVNKNIMSGTVPRQLKMRKGIPNF